MNILKTSSVVEYNEYKKISTIFNFEEILNRVLNNSRVYRFFNISFPDNEHICIEPNSDIEILTNIIKIEPFLELEEKALLLTIRKKQIFKKIQKKRILMHLHLDWMLMTAKIREYENAEQVPASLIESFHLITGKSPKPFIRKIQGNAKQRSNIYTINKDSIVVSVNKSAECQNIDRIHLKTTRLIQDIPLLSFIEISKGVDEDKLATFLEKVKTACIKIQKERSEISEDMKFCLKIRKIKRTLKRAMYIQNQNSIIVDPRHTDSFFHELGHWYHTHFIPSIDTVDKAEAFAEQFALEF